MVKRIQPQFACKVVTAVTRIYRVENGLVLIPWVDHSSRLGLVGALRFTPGDRALQAVTQ